MFNPYKLIDPLLARLPTIAQQCGQAFPLYTQEDDSAWKTSRSGSWMGGFWAAAWWLKALREHHHSDQIQNSQTQSSTLAMAQRISQALQAILNTDSIHRAFVFWYGAGWPAQQPALQAMPQHAAMLGTLHSQACQALAASFNHDAQCFPVGQALGGTPQGAMHINPDALAPLLQLLTTPANTNSTNPSAINPNSIKPNPINPNYVRYAQAHVNSLVQQGLRPSGAIHLEGTPQGWARGHAWAMLGLSIAANLWGQPYIEYTHQTCTHWLQTHHNTVLSNPNTADPSALVIATLAMHRLNPTHNLAQETLSRLQNSPYLQVLPDDSARFCGARYALQPGTEALVESPWSTWMLLELLLTLETQP